MAPKAPIIPEFKVIPGHIIKTLLESVRKDTIDIVKETYLAHEDAKTINPDSYFLRFPETPSNRIIALPAAISGQGAVSGIKWIASYPANTNYSIPRASATLILNDYVTGYPFALLEAAMISACRTASSAVLAARHLSASKKSGTISFIGGGVIARHIFNTFLADDWVFEHVTIHDIHAPSGQALYDHVRATSTFNAELCEDINDALGSSIVVFATTALKPYVLDGDSFSAGQLILNVSLRDLGVDVILNSHNFCDDVDHCLKANTSPHLAQQKVGHSKFINGTIGGVVQGKVDVSWEKPIVFSPFGMGILDLAVGKFVFEEAVRRDMAVDIFGFFGEEVRW